MNLPASAGQSFSSKTDQIDSPVRYGSSGAERFSLPHSVIDEGQISARSVFAPHLAIVSEAPLGYRFGEIPETADEDYRL
jgi:hypothetical protein